MMVKIKICGIRTLPDALAAAEAGADMLGFNFYAKSPRFIDVKSCKAICSALRPVAPSILLVGVFVNATAEQIGHTLMDCGLDLAQLSGDESPPLCQALSGRAFKAFHGIPGAGMESFLRQGAPALLLDAAVPGAYGGTGAQADWDAAAELARAYPLLLAGGLRPDNVARAVEQVQPWGVDVASGVEAAPGVKDAGRMRAFVQAARSIELESQ